MLKKATLLVALFSFFTFASALNATLTKTLFFVNGNNQLSYKLLNTRNGIISYSIEPAADGPVPQYLLLNPRANTVTPILMSLMDSCGHKGASVYDRLHYHVLSSTLVYYCTANNSLLVLDENDYTVQAAILTHLNQTFAEAKLSSDDGYGIFILAMGSLYTTNQTSHLVFVNLLSKSVVSSFALTKGLESRELVNDFASNGDFRYILTNKVDDSDTTVTIYFLYLETNDYLISPIINFTNTVADPRQRTIASLYCVGNYLITNNLTDLLFVNTESEIVYRAHSLATKVLAVGQPTPYLPGFVAEDGGQDLYAQFQGGQVIKYSVADYTISQQELGFANDMQIAFGTNETNPLLFTISLYQQNFTIQDLSTSEVILHSVANSDRMYLTNSTYAVKYSSTLYVYNMLSSSLLGSFTSIYLDYFDAETNNLYYLEENLQNFTCKLNRINLETVSLETVYNGNLVLCGTIVQLRATASGFVEVVSAITGDEFIILSETYGLVHFNPPLFVQNRQGISIDFDTLSMHYLQTTYPFQIVHVHYYEYDDTTGFTEVFSYDIEDMIGVYSFQTIGIGRLIATGYFQNNFTLIDLNFGSGVTYNTSTRILGLTTVTDKAWRQYLIFTDEQQSVLRNDPVTQPSLFDSSGVNQLPGSNNYTVRAASAGACSYWVVDGYIASVTLAKFYNICPQSNTSTISQ